MLSTLAMIAVAWQPMALTPSNDVWVYPHSTDPGRDSILRVWGLDGFSVPANAADAEAFSMAYLTWDLTGVPKGLELEGATLVLHQVSEPGYTIKDAEAAPLEARPLFGTVTEKNWNYALVESLLPKREVKAYGTGHPAALGSEPIKIEIDLLKEKGLFSDHLTNALEGSKPLSIALTSAINMADLGRTAIYKIYSKEEKDERLVPKLVLQFKGFYSTK